MHEKDFIKMQQLLVDYALELAQDADFKRAAALYEFVLMRLIESSDKTNLFAAYLYLDLYQLYRAQGREEEAAEALLMLSSALEEQNPRLNALDADELRRMILDKIGSQS